ncbi:hypothetical protein [Synechococcus sp. BA-132 BA5]|uniref:hypothetical protein n=1 Tax=Synechococcus sp. BA-132 BA5 TaxID=3110252 RepID=UPI002B1EC1F5|nr:hypothetical protein [Synechococcus sp. BA-132 BA5]MEA5414207.1 hypothetical protein [Synechococcus sp. BA-132 BA5]
MRALLMPRQSIPFEALILSAALLGASEPAQAATLDSTVASAGQSLQRAWQSDPLTRKIPFPPLVLLPAGEPLNQACPSSTPAERDRGGLFCPAEGKVLLARNQLEGALLVDEEAGISYRIAVSLGQAIQSLRPAEEEMGPQARNLQATCLGGLLLASGPAATPKQREAILKADMNAYAESAMDDYGEPRERAYALLTGMGVTKSTCKAASMSALAKGMVPDPDLLLSIKVERGSSLKTAINSQCRRPPTCPRLIEENYDVTLP